MKNASYLPQQRRSFLIGEAGPDFPQEGREKKYKERATLEDLTPLGKYQMGIAGWELKGNETQEELELLRECTNIIYT